MKEALKKYLEENLVVEKKKNKSSFYFPSFSFNIKKIFTEECDEDIFDEIQIKEENVKPKKSGFIKKMFKDDDGYEEDEISVEQIKKEVSKLPDEPREKSSSSVKYSLDWEACLLDEEKEMSSIDISTFIEQAEHYSDFQTLLFKMIDDRELKDSDVYNKVHIDRRLFSKIRSNKDYHPSKETVLLLAFALELSESEMEQLLDSASYSLPRNNKYDLIIRFCFINKIYNIMNVNDLLDEHNCELFSY